MLIVRQIVSITNHPSGGVFPHGDVSPFFSRRDIMPDYLTVRSHGVVTYCDGLIARIQADQAEAYLLSLVGSPEHIQAT